MGLPQTTMSPNSLSTGMSTRLVSILSIAGGTAMCADRSGFEVRVPLYSQRAKGLLPQVGENWMVARDVAQADGWGFALFIGAGPESFVQVPVAPVYGIAILTGITPVVVSCPSVDADSLILLTIQVPGGTPGSPYVSGRVAQTGFYVVSTSATDTSTVGYQVIATGLQVAPPA